VYHAGIRPTAYFWRDQSGHEIDLIIERGEVVRAVEIKSGETLNPELFDGLRWFCRQTDLSPADCTLVYGGEEGQSRSAGRVLPWNRAHKLGSE
jgi:predicted AAA+ superfamily ATPase